MKQTAVSVVIPFFGSEEELRLSCESLCRQTFRDFEIIIVADGVSVSPAFVEGLRRHAPVKLLRNAEVHGPFQARLRGAREATGEYLWFMDHDDSADERFMELATDAAEQYGADIVETPVLIVPESGDAYLFDRLLAETTLKGTDIIAAFLRNGASNSLCNKIIRRTVWGRADAYLTAMEAHRLTFGEDLLCMFLLYELAESYAPLRETYYKYLFRRDSATNTQAPERALASISSLAIVMPRICELASRHGDPEEVRTFLERKFGWALISLSRKAGDSLDERHEAIAGSLRRTFLAH